MVFAPLGTAAAETAASGGGPETGPVIETSTLCHAASRAGGAWGPVLPALSVPMPSTN